MNVLDMTPRKYYKFEDLEKINILYVDEYGAYDGGIILINSQCERFYARWDLLLNLKI